MLVLVNRSPMPINSSISEARTPPPDVGHSRYNRSNRIARLLRNCMGRHSASGLWRIHGVSSGKHDCGGNTLTQSETQVRLRFVARGMSACLAGSLMQNRLRRNGASEDGPMTPELCHADDSENCCDAVSTCWYASPRNSSGVSNHTPQMEGVGRWCSGRTSSTARDSRVSGLGL